MAGQNFSATVDQWVQQSRARLEAVFRLSAQYVIEDVISRTPRDTGFLVNSLTVTLGEISPIDPNARPPEGTQAGAFDAKPYALTIANAQIGGVVAASFVASYAGFVEYGAQGRAPVGMVRLSAQNWPIHVQNAVNAAKAAVASRSGS